jgi:hypothetical protein
MPRPVFPEYGIPGDPLRTRDQSFTPGSSVTFSADEANVHFKEAYDRVNAAWLKIDPSKTVGAIDVTARSSDAGWHVLISPRYLSGAATTDGRALKDHGFYFSAGKDAQVRYWRKSGRDELTGVNTNSALKAAKSDLDELLEPAEEPHNGLIVALTYETAIEAVRNTFLRPASNIRGFGVALHAQDDSAWHISNHGSLLTASRYRAGSGDLEDLQIRKADGTWQGDIWYKAKPKDKPRGRVVWYFKDEAKARGMEALEQILELAKPLRVTEAPKT